VSEVVAGHAGAREAVENDQQCVHLAQFPSSSGPSRALDDANRGRVTHAAG